VPRVGIIALQNLSCGILIIEAVLGCTCTVN
jgi:hypothetical protein